MKSDIFFIEYMLYAADCPLKGIEAAAMWIYKEFIKTNPPLTCHTNQSYQQQ
jgi:hypothetical protein